MGEPALKEPSVNELSHYYWRRGELSWKLDALQVSIRDRIYAQRSDKIIILSSRQIGKSFLSCVLAIEFCLRNPGTIVRIIAPKLNQVHDIVQDNLAPIIADAPPGLIVRHKSEGRWTVGRSSLRLGACERAHVDNNRGGNASLIITEEGGFVDSENFRYAMESVLGPQLIRSGGTELHISSPSEDEFHYLHTAVLPKCEAKGTAFRYTVYDSPSITQKQIDQAIERCGGENSESFRREYKAEIIRSSTLVVIPEFDVKRHVAEFELPKHYYSVVSTDTGGSKDKWAGCHVAYDFFKNRLLVSADWMEDPNTPSAKAIKQARALEGYSQEGYPDRQSIFADAPPQMLLDWLTEHSYLAQLPLKDDLDAALQALRIEFQQGRILIHPRCKALIGCLLSARWNNQRTDFVRTPEYGHADPLMALVYGNRSINRSANPYPAYIPRHDDQMRNPTVTHIDPREQELANTLVPYTGFVKWQ